MAGISLPDYLHAEPFEQLVMLGVADRCAELRRIEQENLATMIANKVGETFGG